jgi:MerR family copper efflux transcriptional regulator
VSSYTIGEVADRTGFTASALRYYEDIGLVAPARRTGAGYRIYDDQTLGRLAFIGRAKQLGCSLEEITDLVAIWDGERCGPVQRRFQALVTDKVRDATSQIAELTAFRAQLEAAASQLSGDPVDGPCGDDCACVRDPSTTTSQAGPGARGTAPSEPPIACTLESAAMPDRMADWREVLDHARSRSTAPDGTLRVELDDGLDLGELTRLVAAEQNCCEFFSFAITVDHRGLALEVAAPAGAEAIVASLFGQPA